MRETNRPSAKQQRQHDVAGKLQVLTNTKLDLKCSLSYWLWGMKLLCLSDCVVEPMTSFYMLFKHGFIVYAVSQSSNC